jgi:hypothetical protein
MLWTEGKIVMRDVHVRKIYTTFFFVFNVTNFRITYQISNDHEKGCLIAIKIELSNYLSGQIDFVSSLSQSPA